MIPTAATDELNARGDADRVELFVGNQRFHGWTNVRISTGIERGAADFEFGATELRNQDAVIRVRPGSPCEVELGGELVISGFVDVLSIAHDASAKTISIAGRSRTADAMDSSVVGPKLWRRKKIEVLAQGLVDANELTFLVVAEVDTGDPITRHKVQVGETVFETIERAARLRGLLVTDNAEGDMVLTQAGAAGVAETPIVLGENLLSTDATFDATDLYSDYICRGQTQGTDTDFGRVSSLVSAQISDEQIGRKRFLVLTPPGRASKKRCRDYAQYEANIRAGQSIDIVVRVVGWRQSIGGPLWKKNQLVRLIDGEIGTDAELLIAEVTYGLDNDSGKTTSLRLAPREGYLLERLPARKGRGKRKPTEGVGVWDELTNVKTGRLRPRGPGAGRGVPE